MRKTRMFILASLMMTSMAWAQTKPKYVPASELEPVHRAAVVAKTMLQSPEFARKAAASMQVELTLVESKLKRPIDKEIFAAFKAAHGQLDTAVLEWELAQVTERGLASTKAKLDAELSVLKGTRTRASVDRAQAETEKLAEMQGDTKALQGMVPKLRAFNEEIDSASTFYTTGVKKEAVKP